MTGYEVTVSYPDIETLAAKGGVHGGGRPQCWRRSGEIVVLRHLYL